LQLTLSHLVQTFQPGNSRPGLEQSRDRSFIKSEVTQAFHHRHCLIIHVPTIQTAMPQAGRSSPLGLRHAARRTNSFAARKKTSRGTLNRSVHRAALSVSCHLLRGSASAATDADPGRVPDLLAALASCHGGKYLPSPPPTVYL